MERGKYHTNKKFEKSGVLPRIPICSPCNFDLPLCIFTVLCLGNQHRKGKFMKKNSFILLIVMMLAAVSCQTHEDGLDEIRKFKPDDKYFKAGMVNLHFIIETSGIAHVDSIFDQMIHTNNLPLTADGCKDGVYVGESPYDAFDYKHVAKIVIKDGKILSVDYNEVLWNGKGKREDLEYCKEMSVTGTTPTQAYPAMEKQLLEKQDVSGIDAVSGASYSLYRFRYAVIVALMKAHLAKK